jgi:hypothetical protein
MMALIRGLGAAGAAWRVARAVVALCLVALILSRRTEGAGNIALEADATTTAADLSAALSAPSTTSTTRLVYADSVAPTAAVATLLAGAASRGNPVSLWTPGRLPGLEITAPTEAVAGRRVALDVTLRGRPGESIELVIHDRPGSADTVRVTVGQGGVTTTAIAVEPTRAGPAEWTARARGEAEGDESSGVPGESVVARTWVRGESAVRVLVLSGPPNWEVRYLARALEGAGMELRVVQDLGRERSVASPGATRPASLDDLGAYDVVVLAGGQDRPLEALLHRWMTTRGGGVLLLGPGAADGALSAWSARGTPVEGNTGAIHWAGPAEIVPLPAEDLVARRATLPPTIAGVPVAWTGDDSTRPEETHSAAGWQGRGRIFTSAIESWPWAVEAGLVAEHAAHWESVVEWLAGGLVDDTYLTAGAGTPGVAWTGRIDGAIPETFALLRPTDDPLASPLTRAATSMSEPSVAPETLRPQRTGPSSAVLRLVPTAVGPHALGTLAEHGIVVTSPESRRSWTEVALLVGAAGGQVRLASDDTEATLGRLDQGDGRRWLHFLILAAAAVVAWAARRLEGLA